MMTPDGESCRGVMSPARFLVKIKIGLNLTLFLRERFRGDADHREETLHLQKYIIVALGGSLGTLARYWVGSTISGKMGTRFPYGTFVVNISACLFIGFAMVLLGRRADPNPAWRFLIPIGFVGAYSTFSTFEWETFSSLQTAAFFVAGVYVVASIVLGFVAVWCGAFLARLLS